MSHPDDANDWLEWRKHVLKELERLSDLHESHGQELSKIRVQIATLQVKSGVWGAVAGAIPATLVLIYAIVNK